MRDGGKPWPCAHTPRIQSHHRILMGPISTQCSHLVVHCAGLGGRAALAGERVLEHRRSVRPSPPPLPHRRGHMSGQAVPMTDQSRHLVVHLKECTWV